MEYQVNVRDEFKGKKNYRLIFVTGKITLDSEDQFCESLGEAWKTRPLDTNAVCIDFTKTYHFSSAVLGKLVTIGAEHRSAYDSPLSVIATGRVAEKFKITHLDRIMKMYEQLEKFLEE